MKKLVPWLLLSCIAAAPAFAQNKSEDEAGDVSEVDKDSSGPLRDRIPPVSGHLFLMKGRFEVSPQVGISLRDAFFTKILLGATFTYHFTETIGVALRGAYTPNLISGTAQICFEAQGTTPAGCRSPTWPELTLNGTTPQNKAYGMWTFVSSIDFQWAPIYGKLSLIAEKTLHFNMYTALGPTLLMYGPTNTLTAGGNVAIGFRFFINSWMNLRAELRDVIYAEVGFPPDAAGVSPTSVRNQLLFELGFSMFFPTVFREER